MKHEDNSISNRSAENDLEARVVASVLGEASPFEAAELERRVGANPELALFKQHIETVHRLIGAAVREDQAPMRLAPERRAKILQAIGAVAAPVSDENQATAVILKFAQARRNRRRRWIWSSGLAASLMFTAILALYVVPSSRKYGYKLKFQEDRARQRLEEFDKRELAERKVREAVALPTSVNAPGVSGAVDLKRKDPAYASAEQRAQGVGDVRELLAAAADADSLFRSQKRSEGSAAAHYYFSPPPKVAADQLNSLAYGSGASATRPVEFADRDAEDVPPVVLSPFEVSVAPNAGYRASSTLAGTRVKTNLLDLPGSKPEWGSFSASLSAGAKSSSADTNTTTLDDSFLSGGAAPAALALAKTLPAPAESAAVKEDERLSQNKQAVVVSPQALLSAQGESIAHKDPVSTFSLHVSDVSFRLAQAALARGEAPDPARIRPEEFYNAFDYGDPAPAAADQIGCRIEQAAHPFLQQRNLVRIAMRVPSAGRAASQPLHLTVLLDTSGSMEREDRIASVHRALDVLASLLKANDRVTLIGFARQPRLLVEDLPGDQAAQLSTLSSQTPFTGGTNLEEALKLAGELAQRHQEATAQNRIVFITDGAANLGNADPAQLAAMVENLRQQGIAFDACGVGTDGLDDAVLEALTRKGNGRYYVLDKAEDADAGFARQLAGAFRPAAENVKVQVRFNPARVGHYQLIGFEQHRLQAEDFRNDKVDAAELAADEAAVALYQVEVLPQGEGDLGEVFVRFRDAASSQMVERSWAIAHEPHARAFDRATPTLQLAGTAALLAEKLRGGESASQVNLDELTPVVNTLRGHYASNARAQELITMFEQVRRQSGK